MFPRRSTGSCAIAWRSLPRPGSTRREGNPSEIYSVASAGQESRALGLGEAMLLSISSGDELALKLHPRLWTGQMHGTLARVPLSGGSPRELRENVLDADWLPDG